MAQKENFNPRTPCGVRRTLVSSSCVIEGFQSTHPLRGATAATPVPFDTFRFQSTHPLRGATPRQSVSLRLCTFQSTHPLRGATPFLPDAVKCRRFQSTHPLRGATVSSLPMRSLSTNFNPRTPCGVRLIAEDAFPAIITFQSTHPLRGATRLRAGSTAGGNISIHAPLAGCDYNEYKAMRQEQISIHAPLAGCDVPNITKKPPRLEFQSTHPLRGATAKLPKYSRQICAKATKFLQSRTKSGVAACWAKGKRPLFPALRGANLPGKTGTLPVRIR